ncbi:MAG: hypothetical protein KDB60_11180 [Propionibacteriaceae bacterium]|nr:hypothetical protein [Propionibacteriaceae bacterium]
MFAFPRRRVAGVLVAVASALSLTAIQAPAAAVAADVVGTTVVAPAATSSATIRVASYNVKCANCKGGKSWYTRRGAVVRTILGQNVDVIGIQEASQGWLKGKHGKIDLSQFEDLVNRLGAPYALANTARNNCVNPDSPRNCVYADQGASQGTKIIYNTSTLTLVSQGSQALSYISGADNDRYVAWAIFQDKASGKRFFFANTHLEPRKGARYYELRQNQTREVLAVVSARSQGLPSYVVGDFNSYKWSRVNDSKSRSVARDNAPRRIMLDQGGFIDPLGNFDASMYTTQAAIVGNRIHTNFDSWNDYKRKAKHDDYVNGTYLDYIFTSPGIKVPEWETVVRINKKNKFIGTIPSDHNMVRATTVIS